MATARVAATPRINPNVISILLLNLNISDISNIVLKVFNTRIFILIDPYNITNFSRTDEELEELLIFCIAVAGKTARIIAKSINDFLFNSEESTNSPFKTVELMITSGTLVHNLRRARTGKYGLLEKSLNYLINNPINLRTCSTIDLEKVPGIGFKTSRFFIVHSRPDQNLAVIDTHITKWLSDIGYNFPGGPAKEYEKMEKAFIAESRARNMTISEIDLKIWRAYSNKEILNTFINPYSKLAQE